MTKTVELRTVEREAFEQRFVGVSHGSARVVAAHLEDRVEQDGTHGLLSLVLAPPPGGAETWSTDDMFLLRQEVRRRLSETGVDDVVLSFVGGAASGERQGPEDSDAVPSPGGR